MNKIYLAILTVLTTSPTYAETYVGTKLGWGAFNQSSCDGIPECDNEGFSAGAFLGYEFNDFISTEIGYDYLGSVKGSFENSMVDGTLSAITVMPKFSIPVTERLDLFAKVGAAYIDVDHHDDFITTGALGAEYKVNWNVSISAEYQHYDVNGGINSKADANFIALGMQYKFGSSIPIYNDRIDQVVEIRPVEKIVEKSYPEAKVNINFDSSSSTVSNRNYLSSIIDVLTEFPQSNANLVGYSDSSGSENFNQNLSEARAYAVADYLGANGIDQGRLMTKGKGELEPIASNDSPDGREQNRRVEINIPEFTYEATEIVEEGIIIETLTQEDISPDWW